MPSLQVRNVPVEIYQALKQQANRQHRTIAKETIAILESNLGVGKDLKHRRQRIIDDISGMNTEKSDLPDPVELIREDRVR